MSNTPSPEQPANSSDWTRGDVAPATLTVVGGGVRSGKSRLGVELALKLGERRAFVATAQAFDDEMRERIARHRVERSGQFTTIEAPCRLAEVAVTLPRYDVILVDCLTLYVSNLLLAVGDVEQLGAGAARELEEAAVRELDAGVRELRSKSAHLIFVTNEVGMGVVPVSRLGRLFRDVAGRVNQWIAREADEVWWCALGIPVRLKPSPFSAATLTVGSVSTQSTPENST
jgi:adenosylcobinamide kinase / adenosylcobinamide-phosphate guanylyltransferase